jgi:hypothetical protein
MILQNHGMTECRKAVEKCMSKELIILDRCYSWGNIIYILFENVLREFFKYREKHRDCVVNEVVDSIKKEGSKIQLDVAKLRLHDADISWLNNQICELCEDTPNVAESLAYKMQNCRMYLHAYHACRPTDIKSYYEKGLIPLSKKYIRDYFNQKDYPAIREEKLASAIEHLEDDGTRFGRSCFVTNPEIISKCNKHYLKKGSEALSFVASICGVGLKADTQPTFFVCSVPVRFIPIEQLKDLSAMMLNIIFIPGLKHDADWKFDPYEFYIEVLLPKENILDHFHPAID